MEYHSRGIFLPFLNHKGRQITKGRSYLQKAYKDVAYGEIFSFFKDGFFLKQGNKPNIWFKHENDIHKTVRDNYLGLIFGHNLVNFIEFPNNTFVIIFTGLYFFPKSRLSIRVCLDFHFSHEQHYIPVTFWNATLLFLEHKIKTLFKLKFIPQLFQIHFPKIGMD